MGKPSAGDEKPEDDTPRAFLLKVVRDVLIAGIGGAVAGLAIVGATPAVVEQIQGPSCNDTENLVSVRPSKVGATSWYHEPAGADAVRPLKHEPHRAIDFDSGTAWVERAQEDEFGRGEAIRFEFDEEVDLQLICVINGYAKTWKLYEHNSRARQWAVTTDVDQVIAVLSDKTPETYASFSELHFAKGPTGNVTLEIRSTRAGLGTQGAADTALSEVEFWATAESMSPRKSEVPVPVTTEAPGAER